MHMCLLDVTFVWELQENTSSTFVKYVQWKSNINWNTPC